jgi:HEAT repeat protein
MPTADSKTAQRLIVQARREGDVDTLVKALTDPENRAWAARYLGDIGDPKTISPLIRLLSVRDFQARAAATIALGKLGAVEAVPALLACVDRGPEDVMRAWAIDALGKIGSNQAAPRLIQELANPDRTLWRTAAVALGAIGDAQAIPALEQAARQESWIGKRHYRRAPRQIKRRSKISAEGH